VLGMVLAIMLVVLEVTGGVNEVMKQFISYRRFILRRAINTCIYPTEAHRLKIRGLMIFWVENILGEKVHLCASMDCICNECPFKKNI
jgi:hypothetical protein